MILVLLLLLIISAPDAVFLEHKATLDCSSPDSGYTETTSEVIIPLNARGVWRYSKITASCRDPWETLEITASISHWRSGRGEDSAEVLESPHSSLITDNRLESSLREFSVSFPGIEIGDTLRIEIIRNIRYLPMADFYSYTFYTASRDSIRRGTFRVFWPSSRELHIQSEGEFETLSYPQNDSVDCRVWTSGPSDPVPNIPFSRDPVSLSPFVNVSSSLPEEVSRGLYQVLDENSMVEYSPGAESVILGTGSRPEAISGWISREIEYLSGNWGTDPGYSPRSPLETLEDRSGVCRDRAVLLLWLLRGAGYDPFAVLTASSGNLEPFPGSRSFDHMLVALEDATGNTLFLDPTNSFLDQGFTYTLRGRSYLPLTPSGSSIGYFPDDSSDDSLSIVIEGVFNADSSMILGSISADFSGAAEELFRSMLSSVAPSRRDLLLERLFGLLPGAELTVEGDLSAGNVPLRIYGNGKWECGTVNSGEIICIIIPGFESLDVVSSRAAAYILPCFREDINIETPYTGHVMVSIGNLPDGIPVLPEPYESKNLTINIGIDDSTLIMDEYIILKPVEPNSTQLRDIRLALLAGISSSFRTVLFR